MLVLHLKPFIQFFRNLSLMGYWTCVHGSKWHYIALPCLHRLAMSCLGCQQEKGHLVYIAKTILNADNHSISKQHSLQDPSYAHYHWQTDTRQRKILEPNSILNGFTQTSLQPSEGISKHCFFESLPQCPCLIPCPVSC